MTPTRKSEREIERDTGPVAEQPSPKWKPKRQEVMIMLTLAILSLMVSLDATVIVTSLAAIVQALNATATQGFWIGTSYLLVVAVTMPLIASISNIVGRPQVLFVGVISFTLGSILCAVSRHIGLMLVGRCIQGVGGGAVIIISLVIFSDIVPLRFRPQYVGVLQGAWAFGSIIGPIIGGAVASPGRWRWVFWLMLPFCGMGLVCIWAFVSQIQRPEATVRDMMSRVDWVGGILFIGSATSFLVAVSWGGTTYAWDSWTTLVPLVVGIVGLVVTMAYERLIAGDRAFLRHSLFHVWSAHSVYFGAFTQGLVIYTQLYYLPFFFESVKLYSPIITGCCMLPVVVTLVPSSVFVGRVITRTAKFRWAIISGWIFTTLGTGLLVSWNRRTSIAAWAIELVILGIGHGLILNAINIASQAVSKAGDEGDAVAMYAFLRSFGMAMGVGISGSVFQNVMKSKLKGLGLPTAIAVNAEGYLRQLHEMGDTPKRRAIIDAYAYGFHGVYGFLTALAGVALITSLFIKHYEINKELSSNHRLSAERLSWRISRVASVSQEV